MYLKLGRLINDPDIREMMFSFFTLSGAFTGTLWFGDPYIQICISA